MSIVLVLGMILGVVVGSLATIKTFADHSDISPAEFWAAIPYVVRAPFEWMK